MPFTKDKMRAYMRTYLRRRYHTRMAYARQRLGDQCANCGAREHLEFDHKDRNDKSYTISDRIVRIPLSKLDEELNKCQLLCKPCHIAKTRQERNQPDARTTHGTLSSYRYCKCGLCRAANAQYVREYKRAHRTLDDTPAQVA